MKETMILKVSDFAFEEKLKILAKMLAEGKTVAFPTETVYGLGANALDESAISQIYAAKGRPSDNPLIVHIADLEMLEVLVSEIKPYAKALMAAFWPGPIAFIFKKCDRVPTSVTGGLDTVAVRMPDHEVARALIRLSGVPVAAPSANLSGKPSPTLGRFVAEDLFGRVDCIIDGGAVSVGLESTVLDVTGEIPVILRPGKITKEAISEVVGACDVDAATESLSEVTMVAKSPGMKYKHYAPNATLHVYLGDAMGVVKAMYEKTEAAIRANQKVALFVVDEEWCVLEKLFENTLSKADFDKHVVVFSQGSIKALDRYASQLFRDLRDADAHGCDLILARGVEAEGIGKALMNRLIKASEGSVFKI